MHAALLIAFAVATAGLALAERRRLWLRGLWTFFSASYCVFAALKAAGFT